MTTIARGSELNWAAESPNRDFRGTPVSGAEVHHTPFYWVDGGGGGCGPPGLPLTVLPFSQNSLKCSFQK